MPSVMKLIYSMCFFSRRKRRNKSDIGRKVPKQLHIQANNVTEKVKLSYGIRVSSSVLLHALRCVCVNTPPATTGGVKKGGGVVQPAFPVPLVALCKLTLSITRL